MRKWKRLVKYISLTIVMTLLLFLLQPVLQYGEGMESKAEAGTTVAENEQNFEVRIWDYMNDNSTDQSLFSNYVIKTSGNNNSNNVEDNDFLYHENNSTIVSKTNSFVQGIAKQKYENKKIAFNANVGAFGSNYVGNENGSIKTIYPEQGVKYNNKVVIDYKGKYDFNFFNVVNGVYTYDSALNDQGIRMSNNKLVKSGTEFWLLDNVNTNDHNLGFGMQLSFGFFLPKGGLINSQPMTFKFTGDDDVWVYFRDADDNGTLILDMGGIHSKLTGEINFETGLITYKNTTGGTLSYYNNLNSTARNVNKDEVISYDYLYDEATYQSMKDLPNKDQINRFCDISPDRRYSLDFYYVERNPVNSNCSLQFRMDPIPEKDSTVYKTVEGPVLKDETYEYKLYYSTKREILEAYRHQILNALANNLDIPEMMSDDITQVPKSIVGSDYFTEKLNQGVYYFVYEVNSGSANSIKSKVDSKSEVSGKVSEVVAAGKDTTFTNKYIPGTINISKKIEDLEQAGPARYNFKLTLYDGDDIVTDEYFDKQEINSHNEYEFTLENNKEKLITNLPKGIKYKVIEEINNNNTYEMSTNITDGNQSFEPGTDMIDSSNTSNRTFNGEINCSGDIDSIVYTNTVTKLPQYYNLKIQKKLVDKSGKQQADYVENSFIYRIKDKSNNEVIYEGITLNAGVSEKSTEIISLKEGTYEIEELDHIRYKPSTDKKQVTLSSESRCPENCETVTFENYKITDDLFSDTDITVNRYNKTKQP